MRVAEVIASGERGGGSEHVASLSSELLRLGIEPSVVVSPDGPLGARIAGLGIKSWPVDMMASRLSPSILAMLHGTIRRIAPDLVHAHGTRGALYTILARPGVPVVYTAHGLSYRQSGHLLTRVLRLGVEAAICRTVAEVISVSSADLADLRRRRILSADKGVHIGNALPLERFGGADRTAARRLLGLPDDAFVVGSVGRLVPQKAVADTIDAVLLSPLVTLVIVGDGPLRSDLVSRALPAGDRIRFLGTRDDVPEILPAFDVFALSSAWEGQPIALQEAMAAGLPCVATRTAGSAEVLDGGRLGILTAIHDPESLAAAFERLRVDPIEGRRLADASRAKVQAASWNVVAACTLAVYSTVLAHSKSKRRS